MPRRKKNSHENHSRSSSLSINKDKPQQRYAANARERARMRVLSRAFCRLKTTLPWVPADTKLSKLDTLRLAASYIAHLKGILRDETLGTSESSLHPAMSLTWPFGFNRPLGGGSQPGGSLQGSDLEDMDEEEEDNENENEDEFEDEESISSCTWDEVGTKECIHLDTPQSERRSRSSKGNSRRDTNVRPSPPQSGGRARGKQNNNNSTATQVRKKESSPLNKQSVVVVAPRPLPLSQAQNQLVVESELEVDPEPERDNVEHFHNESNNNFMFHHHHHPHHSLESGDKLCLSPTEAAGLMTVTNLENAPPTQYPLQQSMSGHNEILVGIGGSIPIQQNNESFVEDAYHHHHHHHHHHNQYHQHHENEMQSQHHIAPQSNPFGFNGNDLISIG